MPTSHFLLSRLRNFWQPRRSGAIAEACLIGLVAAMSAVALKFGSGALGAWRVHLSNILPPILVLPIVGLGFGLLAGLLVERLAPEASGSGIPQVKASLANIPIKLSWRVAFVKLLSAIMTIASGLTLGRQGPTVQVGAGLAAGISQFFPTSPDHRRQMIAAGAGAGLAAAFNAPIAGVLFIIEELLHDLSDLTLGTAIIAAFIGGVVSRLLGGNSLGFNLNPVISGGLQLAEIPFYLILGAIAGILAALFNRGLIKSLKIYNKLNLSLSLRVGLAGLLGGIIVAFFPPEYRDNAGLRDFVVGGGVSASRAMAVFITQFFLTLIAFGSGAPGGLFAPSLMLGSCLGYIVGVWQDNLLGITSPTVYALAGMGAFFSAVSKVPITAIVIVFEMTTDFELVLPLMITSVTSYLIAEKIFPGSLYGKILELKGINITSPVSVEGILSNLSAADVMQPRVETLDVQTSVEEVMQAFSRSHHRGFPVVQESKLVGIVSQSDLLQIRDRNLAKDTPLGEIMTPHPITVSPQHNLSNVLYILDRNRISRLPVVEGERLIGIITRADIIRAEADKLNCKGVAAPATEPSYVVYQTRSPSTGRGRILVPVANPETSATLLEMAGAIARDRHYEIECVQIMLAPRYTSPATTTVRTTKSRRLLRQAEALGKKWRIPVHTQIRVTHDIATAILETIQERHINLILMGWKGNTSTPGRIFGDIVDTIIRQATCEVVLVKIGRSQLPNFSFAPQITPQLSALSFSSTPQLSVPEVVSSPPRFNHWLVPMAGGPNAWVAIRLLPSLITLAQDPKIRLTRVFRPNETEPDLAVLEQATRQLIHRRQLSSHVVASPIQADSVATGIINLVQKEKYDVVVLGASREGLLKQAITGNIPEEIATNVNSTVILVRSAIQN